MVNLRSSAPPRTIIWMWSGCCWNKAPTSNIRTWSACLLFMPPTAEEIFTYIPYVYTNSIYFLAIIYCSYIITREEDCKSCLMCFFLLLLFISLIGWPNCAHLRRRERSSGCCPVAAGERRQPRASGQGQLFSFPRLKHRPPDLSSIHRHSYAHIHILMMVDSEPLIVNRCLRMHIW